MRSEQRRRSQVSLCGPTPPLAMPAPTLQARDWIERVQRIRDTASRVEAALSYPASWMDLVFLSEDGDIGPFSLWRERLIARLPSLTSFQKITDFPSRACNTGTKPFQGPAILVRNIPPDTAGFLS
jgi:hypothetical protein